jgi:hypothetical protein
LTEKKVTPIFPCVLANLVGGKLRVLLFSKRGERDKVAERNNLWGGEKICMNNIGA